MGRKNQIKGMNVQTRNVGPFFPSRKKPHKSLQYVEDYCRWGISLKGLAEKLNYKTMSGALKFLHKISAALPADSIFEVFQPDSVDIFHADEVESNEKGKSVYRLFVRGGGNCKVVYAWGYSQVRNYLVICSLVKSAIKHNRKNPKIWVTDGLCSYHSALIGQYGKDKVRTVFIGRSSDKDIQWLNSEEKQRVYSISKSGTNLIIYQGLVNKYKVEEIEDSRHYTTTIETVLRLFSEANASCVFIQASEKTLPFTKFSQRFINATKGDDFIYHFIGHCTNGNTFAEIISRIITRRISWFDETTDSTYSARLIYNLQMIVYNLFNSVGGPDGPSPFEEMGVKLGTHEETWKKILPNK